EVWNFGFMQMLFQITVPAKAEKEIKVLRCLRQGPGIEDNGASPVEMRQEDRPRRETWKEMMREFLRLGMAQEDRLIKVPAQSSDGGRCQDQVSEMIGFQDANFHRLFPIRVGVDGPAPAFSINSSRCFSFVRL